MRRRHRDISLLKESEGTKIKQGKLKKNDMFEIIQHSVSLCRQLDFIMNSVINTSLMKGADYSGFQMTVEKPKPKQLLPPITTRAGSAMNQEQCLAITCNSLKAREESRVHGAIGFGFASHWLKTWRESFKPITKRSNRDHVITFDSHLKTG